MRTVPIPGWLMTVVVAAASVGVILELQAARPVSAGEADRDVDASV